MVTRRRWNCRRVYDDTTTTTGRGRGSQTPACQCSGCPCARLPGWTMIDVYSDEQMTDESDTVSVTSLRWRQRGRFGGLLRGLTATCTRTRFPRSGRTPSSRRHVRGVHRLGRQLLTWGDDANLRVRADVVWRQHLIFSVARFVCEWSAGVVPPNHGALNLAGITLKVVPGATDADNQRHRLRVRHRAPGRTARPTHRSARLHHRCAAAGRASPSLPVLPSSFPSFPS